MRMKPDADFRDEAAMAAMAAILSRQNQAFDDESLCAISAVAYDSASMLTAERARRYGPVVPANPRPTFEAPDPDQPIPYRPATNPPPPMTGAEFLDNIQAALPDAFADVNLDELEPASATTRETTPAPPPRATTPAPQAIDGGAALESDVDAAWGGLSASRGPIRHCDDSACGCGGDKS